MTIPWLLFVVPVLMLQEGELAVMDGPVCCCWTPAYQIWVPQEFCWWYCIYDHGEVRYVTDGPLAGPDREVEHVMWLDFDNDCDVDLLDLAEFQLIYPDIQAWNLRLRPPED